MIAEELQIEAEEIVTLTLRDRIILGAIAYLVVFLAGCGAASIAASLLA